MVVSVAGHDASRVHGCSLERESLRAVANRPVAVFLVLMVLHCSWLALLRAGDAVVSHAGLTRRQELRRAVAAGVLSVELPLGSLHWSRPRVSVRF